MKTLQIKTVKEKWGEDWATLDAMYKKVNYYVVQLTEKEYRKAKRIFKENKNE